MSWTKNPNIEQRGLCKIGLHDAGEWKTNVEPDSLVEVTLVVKRRWCNKCKAMQYKELERHA